MDRISKERRSWNMSRIKGRDTKPEMIVRSALHKLGYRFRLHSRTLPGKPDIVLAKHKTVIFVHGCFWHRHENCKFAYLPKTRIDFWQQKFLENINRDVQVKLLLENAGWRVLVIWECQTRNIDRLCAHISNSLN